MSTDPLAPPAQTYHIKVEDGTIYGAANDLLQAVVLAGSLATAGGTTWSPSVRVVNKDTGIVEAVIGRPEGGAWPANEEVPAPLPTEEEA
jgi:hypothetical protein